MLNIFPKFELVPMTMYFMMLAKQRRPSIIPSFRTARSFSSRMIFAASFATSTPFMTEMPHVRCVQRRSIVDPVADVADHVPTCFEREDDPVLLLRRYAGEDRAILRLDGQRRIVHGVDLVPVTMRSVFRPTSWAIFCVTYWLSPVMMTTETPFC